MNVRRLVRMVYGSVATALMLLSTATQAQQAPPAAPPPSAPSACFPSCRSGYVCVDGQCVSACNPPCPGNQSCTAQAECVDQAASVPPPAVTPTTPSPTASPKPPAAAEGGSVAAGTATAATGNATGGVPVRFEPGAPADRYKVRVAQAGKAAQECDLPCSLNLVSGPADVAVSGAGAFTRTVQITPTTTTVIVSRVKSGLLIGGIVIEVIGLGGTIVDLATNSVGIVDAVVLAVLAGTGAAMVVGAGGNRIEVKEGSTTPTPHAGMRFKGVRASPTPGGGGLLSVSFAF